MNDDKPSNGPQVASAEPYHRRLDDEFTPSAPPPLPRRAGRLAWLWVLIAIALVVVIYLFYPEIQKRFSHAATSTAAQPQRGTPVVVAPARVGDMNIYLNGLGSVNALNTVTVRPRVDGELIQVAFEEGQLVQKDQLLAQVDPRPFQAQLEQAQGQLARDQALLENAQSDLKKMLDAGAAVSKQEVDTARALVKQYTGAVKSDEGTIATANLQLTYSRVVAPIAGRIGLRLVDQGNIVHATDSNGLAVITQLQPIAMVFQLPEDNIPQVQQSMRRAGRLVVEAWDRDLRNKLAAGTLMAIDSQIDQTSGTVQLKAQFPNQDNALFPRQFVNARLLVDTRRAVVIVPTPAVQRSPQSTFVYVVGSENTVKMRDVVVGPSEGDETAVESGLSSGEVVVTDGVDRLQDGAKVTTGKPSTTKPGGATRSGASSRPAAAPAAATMRGTPSTHPSRPRKVA